MLFYFLDSYVNRGHLLVDENNNAVTYNDTKIYVSRFTRSLVLTVDIDQYLLQDETDEGGKRWLKAIQDVHYKLVSLLYYIGRYVLITPRS